METTKEKSEKKVTKTVTQPKAEKPQPIKGITFRKATVHDTMAVKELVHMFHEEYLNDLGFQMEDLLFKKIAATNVLSTTWVAKLPDEVIPATEDTPEDIKLGKVVGVFSGYYTTYILNNDKLFHEIVWYVHPDYRSCGLDLYKHCANQVKLAGAKKMVMIHMATDKGDRLTKLYKSLGFEPLETHFVKEL